MPGAQQRVRFRGDRPLRLDSSCKAVSRLLRPLPNIHRIFTSRLRLRTAATPTLVRMDPSTSPDTSLLRTDGLTKRFGSVTAVEGLTIDVQPGVTGLVGANGAGKSTLLKILLGLLPATEGTASVLALDVATDGPAIRERVGYMPEHDCLPPDVSATEFVVHMGRMSGLPTTAARERAADTLASRRSLRGAIPADGRLLHRHAAAGQAGAGAGARPGPGAARRAHERARPGRPGRHARADPADRRRVRDLGDRDLAPARESSSGSARASW